MRNSVFSFLFTCSCAVFLLNAAVFADLSLYLAVGGLALVELSCSLTTLVLRTRLAPIPGLPILAVWSFSRPLSLSLKLVCCQLEVCNILPGDCAADCSKSASLHPATELRSARGRASICSGPCCEFSSGPSVLTFALVESLQFAAQQLLKLFDIALTRSFQCVRTSSGTYFSCGTRDANFTVFLTVITRSLCN